MSKKNDSIENSPIPSDRYTEEYFLQHSDGYDEFQSTQGKQLPPRIKKALELAGIKPGMVILDIGCGRGEMLYHAHHHGATIWGMDYSSAAIHIISQTFQSLNPNQVGSQIRVQIANASSLPYIKHNFDIVFLLDVVEHLTPHEFEMMLKEISRVLKKDGKVIIHTMPNLWYYRFGYPLYRTFQSMRGITLPKDPRDRWAFKDVHVNEQTPRSLSQTLKRFGFDVKIDVTSVMTYSHESNPIIRKVMILISRAPGLRWFIGNDIFAIAKKRPISLTDSS